MKTLNEILNSDALKPYLEKTQHLVGLNRLWMSIMVDYAKHCVVANYQDNELILQVENGAWATRIRFAAPEIIKTLRVHSEFASVKTIVCKIRKN